MAELLGYQLRISFYDVAPTGNDVVVFHNFNRRSQKVYEGLDGWLSNGGVVVVAGIEEEVESYFKLWTKRSDSSGIPDVAGIDKVSLPKEVWPVKTCFSQGSEGRPLVWMNACDIVVQRDVGDGSVYFVSEGSLFAGDLFATDGFPLFLNHVIRPAHGGKVWVVLGHPEVAADFPGLGILFTGNLKFLTLQLILLGLLYALASAVRFGRPQIYEKYRHRSIAYHLAAVGTFYRKAGAMAAVAEVNAEFFKSFLYRRLRLPANATPDEVSKELALRLNIQPEEAADLIEFAPGQNLASVLQREKRRSVVRKNLSRK